MSSNNQSDSEERSKREASRSKDAVSGQSVSPSTHSRRSSVVSNKTQSESTETNLGLPSTLVHDEASGNELTGAELSNDDHDLVDDYLSDFKSSDDLPVTTASHKNKPREKRNSKTLSDNSESASLSDKYSRKTRSQKREQLTLKDTVTEVKKTNNNICDEEPSYDDDIRSTFINSPKGISNYRFSKLMQFHNMKEVKVQGNGFCFLSSLIVTLEEKGISKTLDVLCVEIMTEIRNHLNHYQMFDTQNDSQEFIEKCSDYLQKGEYYDRAVDICIGAAANALGINLNIIQKQTGSKTVALSRYDCTRYVSTVNVFLHYYPGSRKGKKLDAHYNCYVKKQYFQKNSETILSAIVATGNTEKNESRTPTMRLKAPNTAEENASSSSTKDVTAEQER